MTYTLVLQGNDTKSKPAMAICEFTNYSVYTILALVYTQGLGLCTVLYLQSKMSEASLQARKHVQEFWRPVCDLVTMVVILQARHV